MKKNEKKTRGGERGVGRIGWTFLQATVCIATITTLQKSKKNSYHILEICQINILNIQIEELKQIHHVFIDINK